MRWRLDKKTKVDLKRDVIGTATQIIKLWRELKNA